MKKKVKTDSYFYKSLKALNVGQTKEWGLEVNYDQSVCLFNDMIYIKNLFIYFDIFMYFDIYQNFDLYQSDFSATLGGSLILIYLSSDKSYNKDQGVLREVQ